MDYNLTIEYSFDFWQIKSVWCQETETFWTKSELVAMLNQARALYIIVDWRNELKFKENIQNKPY